MQVIPPIKLTDAMLLSSNVFESGVASYAPGTAYALDAYASVLTGNTLRTVYQSLQPSNTGHDPVSSPLWWKKISVYYEAYNPATGYAAGEVVTVVTADSHKLYLSLQNTNTGHPITDLTWWAEIGPTNRWASFDLLRNTQTVRASPYVFTIAANTRSNALFLTGLVADEVRIELIVGGLTVYDETFSLSTRNTVSWLSYYTGSFYTRKAVTRFNLPMYTSAQYRITLTKETGDVALGGFGLGTAEYLGRAQWEANSDGKNFSTVERDMQGNASMTPRRRIPKTSQTLNLPKNFVARVFDLRDELDAVPAYWVALEDDTNPYFKPLEILGFYTRFNIVIDNFDEASIQLDLEEI